MVDTSRCRIECFVDDPLMIQVGSSAERRRRMLMLVCWWSALRSNLSWQKMSRGTSIDWIGARLQVDIVKRQAVVTAEHYADDDEDVVITGADDPSMSWAHSRFDCRMPGNLFSAGSKTQNLKCCPNCYCFVCDVEAAKCTMWPTHCMADGSAQ